ncbi:hypothetical protein [Glutamicibacter endophyticus]|uniref:hypothetical protein n=1 Tax=Glutamicibacter endophyticus TaxID=1522174 RepID=UPI003AEF9C34
MSQILQGLSYLQICASAECSTRDVSSANQTLNTYRITAESLETMSPERLAQLFPDGRSKVSEDYEAPKFSNAVKSMKANPHFTVYQAWREYANSHSTKRKLFGTRATECVC